MRIRLRPDASFIFRLYRSQLIKQMYRGLLSRSPDANGKKAYSKQLAETGDVAAALRTMIQSKEFGTHALLENVAECHRKNWDALRQEIPHEQTTRKKILLLGNCQMRGLGRLIEAMTGGAKTTAIELFPETITRLQSKEDPIAGLIGESDVVFLHPHDLVGQILEQNYPADRDKIRLLPRVTFSGYHPDIIYVLNSEGGHFQGPLGPYQSSIAFYGWKNGLSLDATIGLFREDVYEHLGFFAHTAVSKEQMIAEGKLVGLPLDEALRRWSQRGCWMYSMNHPKLWVLADIARMALEMSGIRTLPGAEEFVDDELAISHVYPVYPEIAARTGTTGRYLFKQGTPLDLRWAVAPMMNLRQFVEASFSAFEKVSPTEITNTRVENEPYLSLSQFVDAARTIPQTATAAPATTSATNPYHGLPDEQYWRRAVERVPASEVNPMLATKFSLSHETRIATAGSCFAQHISRTLQKSGFNYFVTENAAVDNTAIRNYGVFSARYGNIYTARQMLQLIDRAYERFVPQDEAWLRPDGRFADPFRPQIEPDGFASREELLQSRQTHYACVRQMFEQLDVLVFTLGLTETWRNKIDGAVFPLAPGVVAGEFNNEQYEFINLTVNDVVADMHSFINRLAEVNAKARIILTVSPVPLIATFEKQHVLSATTYSKSVLRAAAEEIARQHPSCDYFPSYEVITGNYNRGVYFDLDLRSIRPEGIEHVMRVFLQAYAPGQSDGAKERIRAEAAEIAEVICEEISLDPAAQTLQSHLNTGS